MNAIVSPAALPLDEQIAALLGRGEPLTAAQLAAATGKSQASISLAIGRLGERVCKIGAARSTRYGWVKDILGLPGRQQLVWLGGIAHAWDLAQLTYLAGDWLYIRGDGFETLTRSKLPWFLTPLQPQGFLGRELARMRPDFPSDPDAWSLAQVLHTAASGMRDPPGAITFADSDSGFSSSGTWVVPDDLSERTLHFERLVSLVQQGTPARSSAGGEQPKFVGHQRSKGFFIIKFSPPRGTPFGERWHSLLCLEHLALQSLRANGIDTASTELLASPQRTFLQSQRFDHAEQTQRRHVVAIAALHDEFVGGSRVHWLKTCEALHAKKLITQQELLRVAQIFAFGRFIGNTDMHFGNLSFFVDDIIKPKLSLAPVYDMLPMMWRPDVHTGTLDPNPVREQPPLFGYDAQVAQAREWAVAYWQRAQDLPDVESALRELCATNARRVQSNFAVL
jgi:hypothetical protein